MKTGKSTQISIVGAGFSGLTLAWYLTELGHSVSVYEKSDRFGGLISSTRFSKMLVESAANGLMWSEAAEKLFLDLGIQPLFLRKAARKRYIWRDGKKRWPLTKSETWPLIFKTLPKFLFRKSALKPKSFETLKLWGERELGSPAVQFLLEPAFQGVYASQASELSASLLLSRLFHRKKSKYRGTVSAPEGMGQVISSLVKELKARGVTFQTSKTLEKLDFENGSKWVIATSAKDAGSLLLKVRPQWSELIEQIEMLPLMSVAVSIPRPEQKIDGFGMLIPRGFQIRTLGIIANSSLFENRGVCENETWILGGAQDREICRLTDLEIQNLIQSERKKLLGDSSPIEVVQIHRWPSALPNYSLRLEKLQPTLQAHMEKDQQIFLTGNYLGGIGLSQILDWNQKLAARISNV